MNIAKLMIVTLALLTTTPAVADVIVQQKQCHRVWSSNDTITMTMSDETWIRWQRDNKQHIHKNDIRYVKVARNEKFSLVKDYSWTYKEICK